MLTKEDIESFLNRLSADGASYSEVEPGLWIVRPSGELDFSVVVHYSPPNVLLRVKVMTLPTNGIEQDSIVMTEALELSHLDYEEFLAAYESITVALASHLRELGTYREAH